MFLHLSCTFTPPAIINGLIVDFNTMKNEQPNADLALDAAVEKAKLEAQEKSPKGFSVGGLVDTFKKDLGDKEMVENKEKEAKEERLHEELKPLVDRLNELSKAFDISVEIDCGRAEYFLLSDNRREYKNLFSQKYKLAGELIKLRDELSKEYSAKGGTKHPLGEAFPELNYVSNVVRADYDFMLKNSPSFDSDRGFEAGRARIAEGNISPRDILVDSMITLEERRGRIEQNDSKMLMLEGFGISALEAGDLRVAGNTFAVLEKFSSLRPEAGKKIQEILQGLTAEQKQKFVSSYEKGKEGTSLSLMK